MADTPIGSWTKGATQPGFDVPGVTQNFDGVSLSWFISVLNMQSGQYIRKDDVLGVTPGNQKIHVDWQSGDLNIVGRIGVKIRIVVGSNDTYFFPQDGLFIAIVTDPKGSGAPQTVVPA